jgi:4-hydroxybenzoate polyprenyltransferase
MRQKLDDILKKLKILLSQFWVITRIYTNKALIFTLKYARITRTNLCIIIGKFIATYKAYWPIVRDRAHQYALLTRLDRPVGIYLLLWPTLWGLWIAAKGLPDTNVLIVFVLGVVLMRSAGCVLNDIADQRYDPHVSRTKSRPIASGRVSSLEAMVVALTLISVAFLLVLTLNWLTVQLALVAVILAGIYPFMKRYTYLPQFFLGLAFGWAIPMGFAAQTASVPQIAWLLLIANILWSVVYDTMYAMVDREDDLKIGVKSTAILFDDADRVIIGIIQVLVLVTLIMTGKQAQLGSYYFIGLAIASCFFIYQLSLIWNRKPEQCMKAFLNNNWFGLTVFLGLSLDFIINNNV